MSHPRPFPSARPAALRTLRAACLQSLAANGRRGGGDSAPLPERGGRSGSDRLHFELLRPMCALAWRQPATAACSPMERDGVTWYFVDNEQYFKRPELYGYYDDGERFAFFCRAVTELLPLLPDQAGRRPLQRLADRSGAHLPQGRRRARRNAPQSIRTVIYRPQHRVPGPLRQARPWGTSSALTTAGLPTAPLPWTAM